MAQIRPIKSVGISGLRIIFSHTELKPKLFFSYLLNLYVKLFTEFWSPNYQYITTVVLPFL